MRETFGSVRKAFTFGLEPEPGLNNADYLVQCHNARATETGLRPHELVINTAGALPEPASWPYPRLWYFGNTAPYLFYRDAVYRGGGVLDLPVSQPSGPWHVAELGYTWMAANGASLVYHVPGEGTGELTGVFVQSVAAAGNTYVIGGLDGTRFSDAGVQRVLAAWRANAPEVTDSLTYPDASWLMWWSTGGGASDEPFAAELAFLGRSDFARYERVLLDYAGMGRIGFVPTRMGAVRAVLPLGNGNAAVYCAYGVGVLDSVFGDDGVTRFRWRPVLNIGIGGRGHVAGNHSVHYLVDTTGRAWALSGSDAKPLGYRAYLEPMAANEAEAPMVASYDAQEAEAYFAAHPAGCYVLRNGIALSFRDDCPTGLSRSASGQLRGFFFGDYSRAFEVAGGRFDCNQPAMKSVQVVQASARDVSQLKLALDFRYGAETAWRTSPWLNASPEGSAYPMTTATDFRMKVKGVMGTDGRIDYAYYRYKFGDRRDTRGLYGQE